MSNLLEIIMEVRERTLMKNNNVTKKSSRPKSVVVLLIIILLLGIGSISLFRGGIGIGASALMNSYSSAYNNEKKLSYDKLYKAAFDRAEKNYHVSNTAVITLGDMEETQRLEVLTANDIEFITENKDDNTGNVTAWLEVEGQGTFVVDLQVAEYIIDNDHKYVLVRIPAPELTNINIIKTTRKLFSDDYKDGSYSEGVDLALKQRNEANLQIQKSLLSNQYIFQNAKDVAESMIKNLVKQFNQDIPELNVEVEFMN